MFKQLLSDNRIFGAIGCVIVFIAGGLLYLQFVQRQATREVQRTQEIVEQQDNPQTEEATPENETGGHFHADGTWHEGPHEAPPENVQRAEPATPVSERPVQAAPAGDVSDPPVAAQPPFHDPYFRMVDGFAITSEFAIAMAPSGVGPDFASMSDEELAAAIAAINSNHGHPPGDLWPPDGYYYAMGGTTVLSDGDTVWLDDNGHPILKKRDTPYYEISWSEGFRPPPDVYADYKALHERYMEAFLNLPEDSTTSPELERISAEMDAIKQMYRGPVPSGIFFSLSSPPGIEPHVYEAQFRWAEIQMQRSAFEKAGLAYLMDRYDSLKEFAK